MHRKRRTGKIRQKRKRKQKLKKLKNKYLSAESKEKKKQTIEKIRLIAPYTKIKEYLGQ